MQTIKSKRPIAIVTGGAGGIGGAIVAELVRDGFRVASLDRVTADIGSDGDILSLAVDICDRTELGSALDRIVRDFGGVDVLVNAAGTLGESGADPFGSEENWRKVMAVNVDAAWWLSRACTPHLTKSRRGRIINIGSINSEYPSPGAVAYPVSKHALLGLTRCLALDLGKHGVTVNAVLPGAIDTALTRGSSTFESWARRATEASAMKRLGRPEDIAAAVAFLASERSSFVTGHGFYVDGGIHLNIIG